MNIATYRVGIYHDEDIGIETFDISYVGFLRKKKINNDEDIKELLLESYKDAWVYDNKNETTFYPFRYAASYISGYAAVSKIKGNRIEELIIGIIDGYKNTFDVNDIRYALAVVYPYERENRTISIKV